MLRSEGRNELKVQGNTEIRSLRRKESEVKSRYFTCTSVDETDRVSGLVSFLHSDEVSKSFLVV